MKAKVFASIALITALGSIWLSTAQKPTLVLQQSPQATVREKPPIPIASPRTRSRSNYNNFRGGGPSSGK